MQEKVQFHVVIFIFINFFISNIKYSFFDENQLIIILLQLFLTAKSFIFINFFISNIKYSFFDENQLIIILLQLFLTAKRES